MTDFTDRNMQKQLQAECDDVLFAGMELSEQLKQKIRQQTASVKKPSRRFAFKRAWITATASLASATMLIAVVLMLQQPAVHSPANNQVGSVPPVTNDGTAGSELSELITTPLGSAEDAKAAFGPNLLVPSFVPDGYTLKEIVSVGMKGEPVRDVIFTYAAGEKTLTFTASRMPASFPADMFTATKVGSADGSIFEQPGLTELFWTVADVHYSITGNVTGDEAKKIAESAQ
ncbi:DUF4367 domain-containing protein [Paenibacillus montanisoli]|nr:DUF4367 domain-containing protein [Paenibacillus montanisoli]